jgi:glycosyltransferase involved in cell wall biosynthesis
MTRDAMAPSGAGPIVHVVQHMRPGGLEVMALELARAQLAYHPTLIVSLEGSFEEAAAHWPRLRPLREGLHFMGKRPGLDPLLVPRLIALFRRLRPVCVHTHHAGPLLYAGPAARAAGVARRIHTEHDAWHLQNGRRRRVVAFALWVTRPKLVADAPHVAAAVAAALGCELPQVILNGVDTSHFSPGDRLAARRLLGLPESGCIIGIAARLERVKGVDIAIAALAEVPGVLLAIAGDGSEAGNLKSQTASLGLDQRVVLVGHVDDMAGFYRAIDLLCLPSRAEGLPLSMLEAQSTGVRLVACDVGGVRAGLDPESGILVPPEDPAALARALLSVVQSGDQLANRDTPRRFVERTASLQKMAASYLKIALGDLPDEHPDDHCLPRFDGPDRLAPRRLAGADEGDDARR